MRVRILIYSCHTAPSGTLWHPLSTPLAPSWAFPLEKGSWSECKSGAFRGLLIAPHQDHQSLNICGFQPRITVICLSTASWSQVDRRLIGSIDNPPSIPSPTSISPSSFRFYFRPVFAVLWIIVCICPASAHLFVWVSCFFVLHHPRCMIFQGVIPRKSVPSPKISCHLCQFLVSTWDRKLGYWRQLATIGDHSPFLSPFQSLAALFPNLDCQCLSKSWRWALRA